VYKVIGGGNNWTVSPVYLSEIPHNSATYIITGGDDEYL